MVLSVAIGAGLGLLLLAAPSSFGDTAITDPVLLGVMWFVRPQTLLVLVPLLLHFAIGAGIGMLARLKADVRTTTVVLAAVAVNAAGTLVENGYGAGVMGVGWWLIGSVVSAMLMLLGAAIVTRVAAARRLTSSSGSRVAGDR
ncbi:MAG: hypothetical protein ACRDF9_07850 [Candidatus Limnocylindria bacterium]